MADIVERLRNREPHFTFGRIQREEAADEIERLRKENHEINWQIGYLLGAEKERDELQQLFDLQHTRTKEADALYVAAHPRDDCPNGYIPDLGKLVDWLIQRSDEAREAARYLWQQVKHDWRGDPIKQVTGPWPWLEEDE